MSAEVDKADREGKRFLTHDSGLESGDERERICGCLSLGDAGVSLVRVRIALADGLSGLGLVDERLDRVGLRARVGRRGDRSKREHGSERGGEGGEDHLGGVGWGGREGKEGREVRMWALVREVEQGDREDFIGHPENGTPCRARLKVGERVRGCVRDEGAVGVVCACVMVEWSSGVIAVRLG